MLPTLSTSTAILIARLILDAVEHIATALSEDR